MTGTEVGTVVGDHKPRTRQALFLLAAGVCLTLIGLRWTPSVDGPILDANPWAWTAMAAFTMLIVLLGRKWTGQQVQASGAATRKAMLGSGWATWFGVLWAVLLAGASWLGHGRMFAAISVGLFMIPLAVFTMFPRLIGGGRFVQHVRIHPDRIEVEHGGRASTLLWQNVASAKAFEYLDPQSKLDPDFHGRLLKWFLKQPLLTLVLEARSGEVVSISLGAFRNHDEMLEAIRRRLQAAGGPPVEVVPA